MEISLNWKQVSLFSKYSEIWKQMSESLIPIEMIDVE